METKLGKIADKSAREHRPIFTSLYHLLNEELLLKCHQELSGNKAMGIDKVTKEEYSLHLKENIQSLVRRLKNKSYKPLPVKRVYIPKANGKKRPLGLAAYEDKIVQLGLKKILEAVYEPKFKENMYGFRPHRNCHMAIKDMCTSIIRKRIDYIVDADIKGFFDHMNHDWVLKFVGYYIQDPNILNLINKYLKAGILEEGEYKASDEGSIQGGIISPVFTFYCGETLDGKFCVIPRTNSKKFRMKLKEMNQWLKEHRNLPLKELMPKLNQKLIGHYRYYGATYNIQMLVKYHYYVTKLLFKWLNRRSQKGSYTWEQFHMMQTHYPIVYPKRYVNLYG